jgi:hypothetical protein
MGVAFEAQAANQWPRQSAKDGDLALSKGQLSRGTDPAERLWTVANQNPNLVVPENAQGTEQCRVGCTSISGCELGRCHHSISLVERH